ncbi:superoxide dismutase [Oscillibacter ruminantium]|uniref:superoxide dismutase n=1 Tax=Oscillibacter ruminantium TaxID=1263547 RepID=UPI00332904AE
MENHYPFALPPLPYPYDALEPEIESKVLCFHHDKHFATYVENLNKLLEPYPTYHSWTLNQLCEGWANLPKEICQGVRNNAGGVFNHDLYFRTLRALPPSMPQPPLDSAIRRVFGDIEGLKSALKSASLSVFGSGWACLCADCGGDLSIQKVANQDTVLPLLPLLCCDVWEHAYYLQYQNRRPDYFDAWWRLIDWSQVSADYAAHLENRLPIPEK